METDVHFRRDSNADHNRSEHQNQKKHNKSNTNHHINCNKPSKTKDKTFDGQEFNASKDKHQNKNKTQSHREKDNKNKKSSNSVKNNNNFDNDLTAYTNKCNNKKNRDKDRELSKDNSSTTSNHKINKNKDNHLKTNKDVINNNKSLNELLDNNRSLSNRETSLDTNQKNSSKECLQKNSVVKEFKFFKEKAKKKNISEQKAATSKSSKVSTGANGSNSCSTTSCKQVLKSCDVLSKSGVSDGSAKHKSKGGHKETKQWREGSLKDNSHSSTSTLSLGSSATSSANISCDSNSKTTKSKTSAKTNKNNAKYSHSSDKSNDNCSPTKKNVSPNKTISQSISPKATKNKSPVVQTNDKCPKSESKRKNKVNLIKDNPLYDEDIIDGFAILSFKCFDDIEVTINGRSSQKKKKTKQKKEETSIESIINSVSTGCSSLDGLVSSQLKCNNKSNESKSSKLGANKQLKNESKDMKNSDKSDNKSDTKNRVDSKLIKCSKKVKQSENNGNNNNNNKNKNVDNNSKDQQKANNVINSVNSSKSQSLESTTVLTVNKKTSITAINAQKPEISINKSEPPVEDDLKEVPSNIILNKTVSEDNKSISLTTSKSVNPSQHKSPTVLLNSCDNSSIGDCDKTLTAKSRSSASNDSSLSSPSASSATLPLISSDGESDGQLSYVHNNSVNVKNDCESNSSNACSLSKAPINTNKSNNVLTPPPLPALSTSPLIPNSSSTPISVKSAQHQLCGSDVSKNFGLNHKSSEPLETNVSEVKSVNGYERTFQSHFIESVLRNNTPSEESNIKTIEDVSPATTNHCPPSSPLTNKYENNNKENNLSFLSKVCTKIPKTTSNSNFSDNCQNYSSNASNCVKPAIHETIPQSHGLGVKRASSPIPSNQSIASKQIRYSSPNNQTNSFDSHNSVPQQSASTTSRSTSNSLSSLSQLSQSIGQNLSSYKEREDKESTKSCTQSTSSLATNASSENTFAPNFSTPKSQLWSTSSSASNGSIVSSVPHQSSPSLAPRSTTPSIGLSSSLHNNHLSMFASPIPPVSLPSVGGAVAPSATPSPFIGDSLFSHQNQSDFLRRELDTRFLASQDRNINIPPPPYMRPEIHPHMHLTQSQPYPLTPTIGSSIMPSNLQMYEKYPKLDQTFYGRNALGLPGFPSLSPLLTANSSSTAPQGSGLSVSSNAVTPFGTPAHSAAFQPKLNSLSTKTKPSAKSGRWCAMHVRIAWEIYHHQQKQHFDLAHKTGVNPGASGQTKSGAELLRPLNHMFSLGSRTQDLPPFSSALLSAASSRAPFDSALPSHQSQFGSAPASPHLSTQTTNFPRYPSFGGFGSLNSSLSLPPVGGPPTPSGTLFGPTAISGTRDLPIPGCLPGLSASGPDLWSRSANTRPTSALFPPLTASTSSTSSSSSSSWGGLKAEAERNRINDELYNKRKATESIEREAKRFERDKTRTDDRLDVKHRDQSHNSLKHNSNTSSHLRNGDIYSEHKSKDWIKSSKMKDTSRSPVHQSHHSHSHQSHHSHHSHHSIQSHIHSQSSSKSGNPDMSAFDLNKLSSVGVKDEQKNDLHLISERERERERINRFVSDASEQKVKTSVIPTATSSAPNMLSSSNSLAAMGLNNSLEKARLMELFGFQGTPPPMSTHYNANNSGDPMRSYWNPLMAAVDPFKNLHDFQVRPDYLDRDHIFQRYSLLNSSGGGASLMEKLAKESAEKEMLSHSIEKHNSKLLASHLRSNDASFTAGLPIHPPHTPHTPHMRPSQVSTPSSLSSNMFPANPYLNSLHSLSASAGSYVKSNKTSASLHTSSSSTSSSEPSSPSLAPTNGTLPALIPNVLNHSIHSSNLTNSKLSVGSLIDNPLEAIKDITNNKNNESNSSAMGPLGPLLIPNGTNNSVDVLETNSR